MNKLFNWTKQGKSSLLLSLFLAFALLIGGCGGSSDYTDTEAQYYKNDDVAGASLLSAETLTQWDENSGTRGDGFYFTDQGDPVVVVQCVQEPAHVQSIFVKNGHIPGSLPSIAHLDGLVEDRNDGMLEGAHDAPTGAQMDLFVQNLGITKDSVVVLTRDADTFPFCPTRTWWTFHYWGFAKDRVLMLDGANMAWSAIAGNEKSFNNPVKPVPSDFSVSQLSQRNFDARISIGGMMDLVDNGVTANGREYVILDTRGTPQAWTNTDGYRFPLTPRPTAFDGVIKGSTVAMGPGRANLPDLFAAQGKFKSKEELAALFSNIGIDGTKPVFVYCNTGALASLYHYILQEILGYEACLFDAGWTEWAQLTAWHPTMAAIDYVRNDFQRLNADGTALEPNPTFLQSNFFRWDGAKFVDVVTGIEVSGILPGGNMNGAMRWDTLTRSDYVAFRPTATVNDADNNKTYHAPGGYWDENKKIPANTLDQDWPPAVTFPYYNGTGNEIFIEDSSYQGSQQEAPSSISGSVGGGC